MPPAAPGSLQQQGHRGQVGDDQVEVQVERLFHDRGRDQDRGGGRLPLPFLPYRSITCPVISLALPWREPGVQQVQFRRRIPPADSSPNQSRSWRKVCCASSTVVQMTSAQPPGLDQRASSARRPAPVRRPRLPAPRAAAALISRTLTVSGSGPASGRQEPR